MENTNLYGNTHSRISLGGFDLVDSRTVILFNDNDPVEIEELFCQGSSIKIRIYTSSDDDGEHRLTCRFLPEESTVEYYCHNFDNVLGTGTTTPVEFGTYNGRKLYIHFWLYTMSHKESVTRKLEYSVWQERDGN